MTMNRLSLVFAAVVTACSLPAAPAAETRSAITHESLWLLKQVATPVPSPDGRWVVVPVTEPAYDEKDETTDLWLMPGGGSAAPRRLTTAKGKESTPAWSPDGMQIAFAAKREGDEAGQIYLIDRDGGEARRLTQLALGGRTPQWSPDGKSILIQAPVHRDATNDASNKALEEERKKAKSKVRIYDGFPVRSWDKWLDDVQTRLLVMPADGSKPPRDLLAGTDLVKSAGFRGASGEAGGDSLEPEWAPDSQSILFVASTNAHVSARTEVLHQLYEVKLGGGEPRALTRGNSSHRRPVFSPDGTRLGFTTEAVTGNLYALTRLAVADWPWTGAIRDLTTTLDRSVDDFTFAPDGGTIYFTGGDSGRVKVWSVPSSGGAVRPAVVGSEGAWRSIAVPKRTASPILFGSWEAAHLPAEAYRVDLADPGVQKTRLTHFTAEQAAKIDLPPLREFWFTNQVGRAVHSYLAVPPKLDESKKHPLLVLMHGGHASMWTDALNRRWNYHLLAQPGYAVLLTDYVGSTGYGEQFTRDIQGDPLRGPANDINAAADEAIRRFPFIDGSRQAAAGASYGGHLANWMQASTTRYRCLIGHAGLASLYAQWATSDSIHHREVMMGGPFWDKTPQWLDQSPSTYARQFKTPMLLSIGENDFRVPLNNTLEMWALLQRQNVPGRLLVWPDENHWILKGENSRRFYAEVHQWLERWLRPARP